MQHLLKILVVEDQKIIAQYIRFTLEKMGYEVIGIAATRSEVLAVLSRENPDAVLLDIKLLGEVDGFAFGEEISNKFNLPVIYLTPFADQKTASRAKNNAFGYIVKPFKEEELNNSIQVAYHQFKLQKSNLDNKKWLNSTLNGLQSAVITLDDKLNISFMNDPAKKLAGLKNDAYGTSIEEVFTLFKYPRNGKKTSFKYLLNQSGNLNDYYIVADRDRNEIFADITINGFDNMNSHTGYVVVIRDVSDFMETRKALETSQVRHQLLIEQIPDAIYRSTPDGKLLMVNPAFVKMLGYSSKKELLALDIADQIYNLKDDRKKMLATYDYTDTTVNTLRLKKKDGSLIWAEEHSRRIKADNGEVIFYEGVIRDITGRKQSEDMLKNIAEGVSAETGEAFFDSLVNHLSKSLQIDYAFVCEKMGPAHKKARVIAQHGMQNVLSEGTVYDIEGTPCEKVASQHELTCFPSQLQKLFPDDDDLKSLNAESYIGVPLENSRKQTIGHLAIMNKEPLKSNLQLLENMVKIFAIRASAELERKHFEDKLIIEKEKAEEMNRLKTNFLANMSHEIRTPMNSIMGFTTLLEEQLINTELEYFTSRIKTSGDRLLNTINDLLDLAKIESSKIKLKLKHHNVGEQVEIAVGLMGGIAQHKNLNLYATVKQDVFAEFDPNIFAQILNNTIGNALKFTEKGEVEVIVDSISKNKKELVRIRVRDTGIGIEEDFISQVFDEFKQESEGLSRRFEGTGLGLTITQKYVNLLNGNIDLESTKGNGTTVNITLPRVLKPVQYKQANKKSMNKKNKVKQTGSKPRILLVEDNDENKDVAKLILKNHFHVEAAYDGKSAISEALNEKYDAVLMDINLGRGMNGSEVKTKLKALPAYQDVPIIAITAYAMRGDKEKYLNQGFDCYLAKPFSKEDLINIISKAIDLKHVKE